LEAALLKFQSSKCPRMPFERQSGSLPRVTTRRRGKPRSSEAYCFQRTSLDMRAPFNALSAKARIQSSGNAPIRLSALRVVHDLSAPFPALPLHLATTGAPLCAALLPGHVRDPAIPSRTMLRSGRGRAQQIRRCEVVWLTQCSRRGDGSFCFLVIAEGRGGSSMPASRERRRYSVTPVGKVKPQ
jgi:hypothetical protein